MKTLKDIELKGKKVLVRVDFNVPLKKEGDEITVADDERIKAALPTINYLADSRQGCSSITLISHLGRPKGKVVPELSLEPVAVRLAELLDRDLQIKPVLYAGKKFFLTPKRGQSGPEISLLENLRFRPEEEAGDIEFAKELALRQDIFVQEAFACCHRPHASITGIPKFLPSCAGFLLEKEIEFLEKLLTNPKRPFVAILGGAKVSDKIGVIENLLNKVDTLLIGGAMAYTFLKAKGFEVGDSLLEKDKLVLAKGLLRKAKLMGIPIFLPHDHVITNVSGKESDGEESSIKTIDRCFIPKGWMGVDIGPDTREIFKTVIEAAGTIFWNGPVGAFDKGFPEGTYEIARFIGEVTVKKEATSVIGGGETNQAVQEAGTGDQITHRSTGGGATLEFLEGKSLPGIAVLD